MRLLDWIYVTILIVPGLVRMVEKITTDTGGLASRYGPVLAAILLAAGFIGYRRQTAWFNKLFWQFVFYLLAVMYALLALLAVSMLLSAAKLAYGIGILASVIISVPALWCLYRYSAHSHGLWAAGRQ